MQEGRGQPLSRRRQSISRSIADPSQPSFHSPPPRTDWEEIMTPSPPAECKDNPDLSAERHPANFPGQQLSEFIWGGEDRLRRRREIAAYVSAHADELQPTRPPEFMCREERVENVARLAVNMMRHIEG